MLSMLQDAGVQESYTLWQGALDAFPAVTLRQGDASCDESVDSVDALDLLRTVARLPNFGLCIPVAGDVDCDGDHDAVDALLILRWVAALDASPGTGCPDIGAVIGSQ
jgi:hypothetical protein